MAIPKFDYGGWRTAEPDVWRRRGLSFACFLWMGDQAVYCGQERDRL